jgi:peptidyl-prolyl cis-trans isomerase D
MWEKAPNDWAAMEAGAKTVKGAASVDFTDATIGELPDPGLAQAAFSAETGKIIGPVKGNWNWYVIRIVSATPGTEKSFDEVKSLLRDRVVADKATDLIYPRANTLDNLLANGNTLDNLPGDLGLIAVSGTMDAQGKTLEGEAAPLPGPDELRKALIDAVFQARIGDPPHLTEAQTPMGPAYYAMMIEDITPPTLKPFESVQARVLEDWHFDQQRHVQNQAAAAMMAAINDGRSFTDAATIAGVTPRLTPQVTRGQSVQGMPIELHRVLFGLKKGEATMVETAEGFIVAIAAEIIEPDSRSDEAGFTKTKRDVGIGIARDVAAVFQQAIRLRSNPQINRTNFDQIVQPQ